MLYSSLVRGGTLLGGITGNPHLGSVHQSDVAGPEGAGSTPAVSLQQRQRLIKEYGAALLAVCSGPTPAKREPFGADRKGGVTAPNKSTRSSNV